MGVLAHPHYQASDKKMKIKRICKTCGKRFEVEKYRINAGEGSFCSHSCAAKAQTQWHMQGENNPNWRGGTIKKRCAICGNEFKRNRACMVNKNHGLYCSKSCAQKGIWKNKNYKRINLICPICARAFSVPPSRLRAKTVYCSIECAQNGLAKKVLTHNTKPERVFISICKKHGLPFKHVGNRSFWIGDTPRINPDFIHTNKRKKICIEVLGAWWHNSLLNQKISYDRTYNGRKALLKAHGWKMIGIWDHDLLREDAEQFVLYTVKKHNIFPSAT